IEIDHAVGSGLHRVSSRNWIRRRVLFGRKGALDEIDGCIPKQRGALDDWTTEVECNVNSLRGQLEDIRIRIAIDESGLIDMDLGRGERWQLAVPDRLEQAERHVEILDKQADRALLLEIPVEIETVRGRQSDESVRVTDTDCRDVDLHVGHRGQVFAKLDARDC